MESSAKIGKLSDEDVRLVVERLQRAISPLLLDIVRAEMKASPVITCLVSMGGNRCAFHDRSCPLGTILAVKQETSLPNDNDCPKDNERELRILPERPETPRHRAMKAAYKDVSEDFMGGCSDAAVVNLALAAGNALDLLQAMFPPSPDGAYVEVVAKLKLALEAVDGGR